MLKLISKYKIHLLSILLGGIAGFLYWHFVGCASGGCPITSKWLNSTLYGMVLGYLLGTSFIDRAKNKALNQNNKEETV